MSNEVYLARSKYSGNQNITLLEKTPQGLKGATYTRYGLFLNPVSGVTDLRSPSPVSAVSLISVKDSDYVEIYCHGSITSVEGFDLTSLRDLLLFEMRRRGLIPDHSLRSSIPVKGGRVLQQIIYVLPEDALSSIESIIKKEIPNAVSR